MKKHNNKDYLSQSLFKHAKVQVVESSTNMKDDSIKGRGLINIIFLIMNHGHI